MKLKRGFRILNVEIKERVVILTVPGFSGEDAVMVPLAEELVEICSEIAFDESVRALVITASERTSPSVSCQREDSSPFWSAPDRIAALGFPTIAAIPGDAIGFGLELAMACDIRVASISSRFGLPQILSGLIPSHGGTQRLPRLVGKAKAMEMILTGDLIGADEALRTALITRMAPVREVETTAVRIAQEMAAKAPVAMRYAKEAICKGQDLTLDQGLRMENDLYLLLFSTKDRVEGIEAFLQKRKPEFRGE